ncbi:unnamed protein product, partial [Oppiella nova]
RGATGRVGAADLTLKPHCTPLHPTAPHLALSLSLPGRVGADGARRGGVGRGGAKKSNPNYNSNPGTIQVTKTIYPEYAKITPLRRVGQPLDIAKGVAFLASSDASFITGTNLVVDGGLVYNAGALKV